VLHHLPDPEAGFRELLAYGRPGSGVIIYVYWSLNDEPSWKRRLLSAVGAVRRATVGLPFPILRVFSWIVAVGCEVIFVLPYRLLRDSRYRDFAETLPLKTYAQFPFRCLYQDQFDRFSAPIEHRYDRHEVEEWLERAGLVDIRILSGAGWRAMGRISNSSVAIERSATIK